MFAFEAGELTKAEFDQYIHLLWNGITPVWETEKVTIEGEQYFLAWYVYPDKIPAGQLAGETLQGVVMDKTADGTVMTKLGDNDYNILVVTQAVQTNNLDTLGVDGALNEAFGALSEDSHPWVVPAVPDGWIGVKNVDEMREAMKIPGAKIILLDDIMINDDKGTGFCLYAKYDCTINLNGKAIEVDIPGKELYGAIYALNGAKVDIIGDGDMKINGGVSNFIWSTGAAGATEVSIYGGNWVQDSEDFTTENNMYTEGFYGYKSGVINIYGGTFNWKGFEKYTINEKNNGVVNVYGGTFINFDPSVSHDSDGSYVAAGYKVVSETQSNGDVWYSVVPE